MKTVIWILVAGVVLIGGYVWFTGQQAPAPVTQTESGTESTASKVDAAIEDAASSTAQKVEEAAEEAEAAADSAATEAAETTGAAGQAASDAAGAVAGDAAAALSVAEFDYDKVVAIIDGSSLNPDQKQILKTGLEQARSNPSLLAAMLDQVKAELGL